MTRRLSTQMLVLVLITAIAVPALAFAEKTRLRARLTAGVEGQRGPRATASYGSNGEGGAGFRVTVRGRNLAAGTTMTVTACGQNVGTMTLHSKGDRPGAGGRMIVSTRNGGNPPSCSAGDSVSVSGGGITLTGTFRGRGPTRE